MNQNEINRKAMEHLDALCDLFGAPKFSLAITALSGKTPALIQEVEVETGQKIPEDLSASLTNSMLDDCAQVFGSIIKTYAEQLDGMINNQDRLKAAFNTSLQNYHENIKIGQEAMKSNAETLAGFKDISKED